MRILFWGTPDFALPTLRRLVESRHELVGVVTRPDRPAGRGRDLRPSPVKRVAAEAGLPVLQPEEPRGEVFLREMEELRPELSVVAAFGAILTRDVLELPPAGSLNVHASLLPLLRGAAPINWAIIRGHERSGVTIMRMVRELDAGPVLRQAPVPIGPTTTAGELFGVLSELGATTLLETLDGLERGDVEEREQDHDRATYAPKMDREDARIDWREDAAEIDRRIRGCDPWPAAWTELAGEPVQLFGPRPDVGGGPVASDGANAERGSSGARAPESDAPGTVLVADDADGLRVAAGSGSVWIDEVKPAGSTRMRAEAWIRGRGVSAGDRFA